MSFDETKRRVLEDTLASMGTDEFDANAKQRLAELVTESDEARQMYLDHCQMQAMLRQSSLLASFKAEQSGDRVSVPPTHRRPLVSWSALAVAACLLFVVGVATATYFREEPGEQSLTGLPVAWVGDVGGEALFDGAPLVDGDKVPAGTLKVDSGSVALRFDHGTTLLVEGPTELSIENSMQVTLKQGKVAARVSEAGYGFTVLGPDSAVVDLGTEFAMAVDGGKGWVEVYDGEVDIALLNQDGHAWKSRLLTATGPVRIDGPNGQIIDEVPPSALPRFSQLSTEGLDVPAEYVRAVLDSEPMHYWRFEKATDRKVNDISGEAVAVLKGGVRIKNKALHFPPGKRNHGFALIEPNRSLLDGEFTVEAWVKPSFTQHSVLIDIKHLQPTSRFDEKLFRVALLPTSRQTVFPGETFRFTSDLWPTGDTGVVNAYSADRYRTGTWQHVVAVRGREQLEIFLNGRSLQSVAAPAILSDPLPSFMNVGKFSALQRPGPGSTPDRSFFKGMVDEVAIYDKAMSAEEVAEHHRLMQVKAE